MAKGSTTRCVAIGLLLIFVIYVLFGPNGPLRESFGYACSGSWCSPYRAAMDNCYNRNTGPIYDDRVRQMCEKQISEGFAGLPGVATPGEPFGGMNKKMLQLLNQHNPNIEHYGDLPIYADSYSFVPAGMTGLEHNGVEAADTERTALMGQQLRRENTGAELREHLMEKDDQRDREYTWGPDGRGIIASGPYGSYSA